MAVIKTDCSQQTLKMHPGIAITSVSKGLMEELAETQAVEIAAARTEQQASEEPADLKDQGLFQHKLSMANQEPVSVLAAVAVDTEPQQELLRVLGQMRRLIQPAVVEAAEDFLVRLLPS